MAYQRPEPLGKHHRLYDFDCGEPVLDGWLKRHASGAHASGSARVFVATLDEDETVVGYYALAAAGLGRSLLQDVLLRCLEAAGVIGARILLVHAKHAPAKAWYMQYHVEESPTDPLHLLMLLKDVRAILQRHGIE